MKAQESIVEKIRLQLYALSEPKYRHFQCGLMPTVDPESVLGIRTPKLRSYAKSLAGTPDAQLFLKCLPHKYYEENNLHGFLIEQQKDYQEAVSAMDAFLPYIDNWATCDMITPKVFKKHLPELEEKILDWIHDDHTYTIRFGVNMLMKFYLDNYFKEEYLALVADIRSDEYYVKMVIAWYFATALAKQSDAALPYIKAQRLDKWTHNKAIQKALESYRVDNEKKVYLRKLKV